MGLPPSTAAKFRGLITRPMPDFRSAPEVDPRLEQAARLLQRQGKGDDRILADINPREARLLHALGDAHEFAKRLQDSGGFGIHPKTKRPVPHFQPNLASTMIGLRPCCLRPHLAMQASDR
jgi:hypothetical protein